MTARRVGTARRHGSERGAALVEAALAMPIVLMLILGVLWGGLMMRTYLSVESAASGGAREASVAGNRGDADYYVLQEVKRNTTALGSRSLQRVIVYKATDFESGPSAACLATSFQCNTYAAADLAAPSTQFGSGNWFKDDVYPAPGRSVTRGATDFVGVYVEAKPFAGTMGVPAPSTISTYKVLRVEASRF